jgi:uncharacterized protein (TIGR02145 family)
MANRGLRVKPAMTEKSTLKTITNYLNKQSKMKQKLIFFIFLMCAVNLSAQVTIGALEEPHEAAVLDLSQGPLQNLGLLLPPVELVKLNLFAPLVGNSTEQEAAAGMVVYNTKIDEKLYPGIHVWDGEKWGRIGCLPATIIGHSPANKLAIAPVGASVTLEILVADSPDLTYQWYEAQSASDYTGGQLISNATGASYSVSVASDASYYYCVVSSSCNASKDTSDVFTVEVNPFTPLSPGSGCFTGRTAFDVALDNEGGTYGPKTYRQTIAETFADFSHPDTCTQTYTFTPSGTVYNVHFEYVERTSGIVANLVADGDYNGAISTPCTATLTYANDLNTKARGKKRYEALKVDIYATYEETDGGPKSVLKLTAKIQDCLFAGAYTAPCGNWLEFLPFNLGADSTKVMPADQRGTNSPTGNGVTNSTIYGNFYQWGRSTDGHEKQTSNTQTAVNGTSSPGSDFIINSSNNDYNWYDYNDETAIRDSLWTNGSKSSNDPCPAGYKVPTAAQWQSIFNNYSGHGISNANGHGNIWTEDYSSPTYGLLCNSTLFLPVAGSRDFVDGGLNNAGLNGFYWSSTVYNVHAHFLYIGSDYVFPLDLTARAQGLSVRCVAE